MPCVVAAPRGTLRQTMAQARDTEGALLDAVRARPEDDEVRLVYGNWLLERGDVRGELIVAQCEAMRRPADDLDAARLLRRARRLLITHGPRWSAPFAGVRAGAFERGFPTWIRVELADVRDIDAAMAYVGAVPGARVDVSLDRIDDLGRIDATVTTFQAAAASSAVAPRAGTRLWLHLRAQHADTLTRWERLRPWGLSLRGQWPRAVGAAVMRRIGSALRGLAVDDMPPRRLQAILDPRHLAALEALDVIVRVGPSLAHLTQLELPALRALTMRAAALHDSAAPELAAMRCASRLEQLTITLGAAEPGGLEALLAGAGPCPGSGAHLPRLVKLSLARSRRTPWSRSLEGASSALRFAGRRERVAGARPLEVLELRGVHGEAAALHGPLLAAGGTRLSSLHTLVLAGHRVAPETVSALVGAAPRLSALDLSGAVDDTGARALLEVSRPVPGRLRLVSLDGCALGAETLGALREGGVPALASAACIAAVAPPLWRELASDRRSRVKSALRQARDGVEPWSALLAAELVTPLPRAGLRYRLSRREVCGSCDGRGWDYSPTGHGREPCHDCGDGYTWSDATPALAAAPTEQHLRVLAERLPSFAPLRDARATLLAAFASTAWPQDAGAPVGLDVVIGVDPPRHADLEIPATFRRGLEQLAGALERGRPQLGDVVTEAHAQLERARRARDLGWAVVGSSWWRAAARAGLEAYADTPDPFAALVDLAERGFVTIGVSADGLELAVADADGDARAA